ncbi:MAG: hypothetical protein H3C47_11155 [Candidatus Cloacimonetes bacterium]|nr:hypothetical protein [Candidatus Cloacimonadota bacterium]
MGFRINNNIAALTANANLGKTQNMMNTSIERLSSGLRINRGADDAAGLTISEKLRGQIRGLNRAILNAQDGISLIQTAEGALSEDASMLNRMRELAIQSMDDALTTNDRLEIQKEVDQLVDEVDRIALTTEFNTKKLLDGSANALVTTNGQGLKAFQTSDAGMSAGDYDINLRLSQAGTRQVQQSNILNNKDTLELATKNTRLQDLTSFYDNDGNAVLEQPMIVTVRGNGVKTSVTVSADMTLAQMSSAFESKITASIQNGGLGLTGSTFAFDERNGQIIFESGREGAAGEIALAAEEDFIKALGLEITTNADAAAYTITAGKVGGTAADVQSVNTTSDTATGAVNGLDFQFQLASQARVDGTVQGQDVIVIGNTNVIFTLADTNSASQHTAHILGRTERVTVTLTAGRTYTKTSIANIINNSINAQGLASRPGIIATFSGYDLQLTSSRTGSSASISILANQAASDVLGLTTGIQVGTGGTAAMLTSSVDVTNGVTIGAQNIQLTVKDGDMNGPDLTSGNALVFRSNTTVSSISLTTAFNTFFSNNNIKATASINSSGRLELISTETGTDSRLSIFSNLGNLNSLGFVSGANNTGEGGVAAIYTGRTGEGAKDIGFTFAGAVLLSIQDANGASSGPISLWARPESGVTANYAANVPFTMSKQSIAAKLDASGLQNTDVTYQFDAAGRLDFVSRSAGKDARIVLSTYASVLPGPTPQASIGNAIAALGINMSQSVQGNGQTQYRVHVADRTLNFQIGANQNQAVKFGLINTTSEALGLKGLDVTNVRSATRALGAIDVAVNKISSERSRLGSLQNRLNSTVNNLTVTSTNLQSTESKIRDVDVAMETVTFTRNQILIQAGTTQLAQAKALPQQALQLLQG